MMTTEHKHAAVLRAIADGVPLSEFEAKSNMCIDDWSSIASRSHWVMYPDEYDVRRKQQHIIVSGFKVPKPLDVVPMSHVFVPVVGMKTMYDFYTLLEDKEFAAKRGIAHATKEAAIAHAKAMLGIDPEAA